MIIAVDTETTGLNTWLGARPFGIGIYFENGKSQYWETCVDRKNRQVFWEVEFLGQIAKYICNPKIEKVFHNAKFDILMLESIGLKVKGKIHDTLIAAKCCNSLEKNYKLKYLAKRYQNIDDDDEIALKKLIMKLRAKAKAKGWQTADKLQMDYWLVQYFNVKNLTQIYCLRDVKRTFNLWKFYEQGMKELNVRHSYDFEMNKLLPVVLKMERRGVRIDVKQVTQFIKDGYERATTCEAVAKKLISPRFNIRSPKQIQEELYARLNFPILEKTKGGEPATDTETLLRLKEQLNGQNTDLINTIIEYRGRSNGIKYFQDYLHNAVQDKIKTWDDWDNWKPFCIHANFQQCQARTFRFSCSMPNLQNVPSPESSAGKFVPNARLPFYPRKGYNWLSFDYSQLELRIAASRSGEKNLIADVIAGKDPVDLIRQKVYPKLTKDEGRKLTKNVIYTKIYGGGPKVLVKKYKLTLYDAEKVMHEFNDEYPAFAHYHEDMLHFAEEHGYIINAFNRKISINPEYAYTTTVNYDIQSSATDLLKRAMIAVDKYLEDFDAHLVLTVHDEIIIEAKTTFPRKSILEIIEIMEQDYGAFDLPMKVEVKLIRENWSKKEAIDTWLSFEKVKEEIERLTMK